MNDKRHDRRDEKRRRLLAFLIEKPRTVDEIMTKLQCSKRTVYNLLHTIEPENLARTGFGAQIAYRLVD